VRRLVPATVLGRTRLAAVVYACLGALPQLAQLNPEHGAARRAAAAVAVALLLGDFVVTYLWRRALFLEPLLVAPAIVLGGVGLGDPMATVGLCMCALVTQSLYGSQQAAATRILTVAAAFPVTIALSPASLGRHIPWQSGAVLGLLPMIAMLGVLMRALYLSLVRHEAAAARETLLARTGSRLLNRTDAREVRLITREAAAELCGLLPGVGVLVLRRAGEEVIVEGSAGVPETVRGTVLAPSCVDGLDPRDSDRAQELNCSTEPIDRLVGGRRRWRAVGLATADADRFLLAGAVRPIPDDIFDAFRTLATQWSLAHANCRVHTELAHRAHHDQLTGLPNRTLFFQRLAAAFDAATDAAEDTIALLIVDLDNFKQVNDLHGHATGDELLVEVAGRLAGAGDGRGMAARFGGDEFALLLTGLDRPDHADEVADRLRRSLLEPFRLRRVTATVGASIGLAGATPELTAGDLMRCADIAMYSAKAKGKNRVERFTESGHGEIAQLRLLEEHLAHAVERGEIVLHYQPHIDLRTGRCAGAEALARWQHPDLGLLPPGTFIPLAERTGHIVALGNHVLASACRQMADWSRRPGADGLRLAVNVAPRQLDDPGFADTVRAVLEDSGLPAAQLTLEITESELIDERNARVQLQRVAEAGVRIAIDDFGTGYASLASLRSFPVHQLKIDRSFLAQGDELRSDEMFRLVISVGEILDLEIVAEGVETEQQAEVVRHAGVPLAQGYLFARPMPAAEVPSWLSGRAAPQPVGPD
jgi:diguanylate cyclase (GGDEF)-like protein